MLVFLFTQSQIPVIHSVLAGKEMSLASNKAQLFWEKLLHSLSLLHCIVL